jgi:hypothetical protein
MRIVPHGAEFAAVDEHGNVLATGSFETPTTGEQLTARAGASGSHRHVLPVVFVTGDVHARDDQAAA